MTATEHAETIIRSKARRDWWTILAAFAALVFLVSTSYYAALAEERTQVAQANARTFAEEVQRACADDESVLNGYAVCARADDEADKPIANTTSTVAPAPAERGRDGKDSQVPGPRGDIGPMSLVPGPMGPVSLVPGPQGDASTVPGPEGDVSTVPGPEGAASTVPGPVGATGVGLVDVDATCTGGTAGSAFTFTFKLSDGTTKTATGQCTAPTAAEPPPAAAP